MYFSERRRRRGLLWFSRQAVPKGDHRYNADIGRSTRIGLYSVQVPLHGPAGLRLLLVEEAVVGLLILTRGAGASTSAQGDDEFGNPTLT